MTTTDRPQRPPSKRRLLAQIAGALAAATAIAVMVVLPAEYRLDPTGFGALTGLTRLAAPRELPVPARPDAPAEIARPSPVPFRSDTVAIRIGGLTEGFGELEYKISMAAGEAVVYSWTAPSELYYEFHGHTRPDPETGDIRVMTYRSDTATASHGTLVAPLDGIHGWYFRNAGFAPVTVELKLSGYYRLEPGILELD